MKKPFSPWSFLLFFQGSAFTVMCTWCLLTKARPLEFSITGIVIGVALILFGYKRHLKIRKRYNADPASVKLLSGKQRLVIIGGAVLWLLVLIYQDKFSNHTIPPVPADYMALFTDQAQAKMLNGYYENENGQNPLCQIFYGDTSVPGGSCFEYNIHIYKIASKGRSVNLNDIKEVYHYPETITGAGYNTVVENYLLQYKQPPSLLSSGIYLLFSTDSVIVFHKDSCFAYYSFILDKFNIALNQKDSVELKMALYPTKYINKVFELAFVHRNGSLYVVFMSRNNEQPWDPNLLYSLLLPSDHVLKQ